MNNNLYAKVDFPTTNSHGWSNIRGYGVLQISKFEGCKIINDKHMYNRIQPLKTPFGDHLPPNKQNVVYQLNSETDLAWATNQTN